MSSSSPYDTYTSPLATRNASPEMLKLWSARQKLGVDAAQRPHGRAPDNDGAFAWALWSIAKSHTPRQAGRGSRRCYLRGCCQ